MSEVMIKGPQDRINWLMVAAFRYCVGRHTTQAMYGVGDVILDILDVLNTEFIKQFIREIVPRSSTGLKTNLRQPNSIGVIDSDYRGEVKAMYESKIEERKVAHSGTVFSAPVYKCVGTATLIKAGDRIAQMILRKKYDADLVEVEELSETERGTGGFGSTGMR